MLAIKMVATADEAHTGQAIDQQPSGADWDNEKRRSDARRTGDATTQRPHGRDERPRTYQQQRGNGGPAQAHQDDKRRQENCPDDDRDDRARRGWRLPPSTMAVPAR